MAATRERRLAADLLREQRLRSARTRDLLRSSPELAALPEAGRPFVTSAVLGVVRTSGTLDAVVDAHLRRGIHLVPRVRDALRLAAYELLYLSTPARVAVSQGVELARRADRGAAGLANAVLRRVAEEDVPRMEASRGRVEAGGCDPADLALVAGLPRWLVRALRDSLSDLELNHLVRMETLPPPVYVAANLARHDVAGTEGLLRRAHVAHRAAALPASFELEGGAALARSGLVRSCDVVPCDLGAQAVAALCRPRPGSRVLEVGQGRGTKSILLENAALSAGGPADIVAVDSEPFKVRVSRERMGRAGLSPYVRCVRCDARGLSGPDRDLPAELVGPFDLVLVDAPCSGTGTMRRHPEIPWSLSEGSVEPEGELPALQRELLAAAATRVASGGTLAYATCSALRAEDEGVVTSFLASDVGRDFEVLPEHRPSLGSATPEGFVRTAGPGLTCDTHFCALLVRRA